MKNSDFDIISRNTDVVNYLERFHFRQKKIRAVTERNRDSKTNKRRKNKAREQESKKIKQASKQQARRKAREKPCLRKQK